ncbi:protein-L-isoaspartate O-methyltransferase [Stereum hirsutum FP-91666 SS1]|uniref:protein-L-isoaspartate O-methyltransferase n=1 Tax=Stereum hirsutum (strain FP-91666) TaxID=721885 RepID=UPI000440A721|nr:protein-L-isoaspartate O-methyltransferase [Stereum hirsutum FP-91666 SS1]EIM88976.1 protein-L-isoaspartate O-methyltransferase [Stereum hirsutum FP-91666 SS1]
MAWTCGGKTNAELIANMHREALIKSDLVAAAMQKVDRANYVRRTSEAYFDSPQTIGHGATISAPHMHAHAAELLGDHLHPGAHVLDVGSGSGYLCAVFHHLVSANGQPGKVVGIEHIPELVEWSKENVRKDGLGSALDKEHIVLIAGDGRQGWAEGGPYDAIHVGAAAPTLPQPLVDQLARPGRMFIPVGTHSQAVLQVDKHEDGSVTKKELFGVVYVPLTDREKQF